MTKGSIVRLEGFLPERRPRARQPRPFGTIKRRGQIWYLKFPYLGTTVEVGTNLPLRERINVLRERVTGEYLVTRPDATTFTARGFWTTWKNALRAACVPYRKPYTSRHTFAIWCLVIGVHPERVVALMGHDSRQMVYEVYGKYVDGLERDAGEIRDYVGEDFA